MSSGKQDSGAERDQIVTSAVRASARALKVAHFPTAPGSVRPQSLDNLVRLARKLMVIVFGSRLPGTLGQSGLPRLSRCVPFRQCPSEPFPRPTSGREGHGQLLPTPSGQGGPRRVVAFPPEQRSSYVISAWSRSVPLDDQHFAKPSSSRTRAGDHGAGDHGKVGKCRG